MVSRSVGLSLARWLWLGVSGCLLRRFAYECRVHGCWLLSRGSPVLGAGSAMSALRLLLAVFWVAVCGGVSAETINATATPRGSQTMYAMADAQGNNRAYSTLANACAARTARDGSIPVWSAGSGNNCQCSGGTGCPYAGYQSSVGTGTTCSADGQIWGQGCTDYSCPAGQNWTLSGTTCTRPDCTAGQTRASDGVCYGACPGIQVRVGSTCGCTNVESNGVLYKGTPVGGAGSVPVTHCFQQCEFKDGPMSVALGGQWSSTLGAPTGATCTASTETSKTPTGDTRTPEQKCLASGQGYVTTSSGTVCTSAGDSPTPVKTVKTQTQEKVVGGVTTTETVTTTCNGDTCTTVVTAKDGSGNVTATTTTTGYGSAGGTAGSGVGSGGGGDGETDCDKYPNVAGCRELGNAPDVADVGSTPVNSSSIDPLSVGGSGQCPADVQLPRGAVFSWQPICTWAINLRPLIIALGWLAAGMIVLGWTGQRA